MLLKLTKAWLHKKIVIVYGKLNYPPIKHTLLDSIFAIMPSHTKHKFYFQNPNFVTIRFTQNVPSRTSATMTATRAAAGLERAWRHLQLQVGTAPSPCPCPVDASRRHRVAPWPSCPMVQLIICISVGSRPVPAQDTPRLARLHQQTAQNTWNLKPKTKKHLPAQQIEWTPDTDVPLPVNECVRWIIINAEKSVFVLFSRTNIEMFKSGYKIFCFLIVIF